MSNKFRLTVSKRLKIIFASRFEKLENYFVLRVWKLFQTDLVFFKLKSVIKKYKTKFFAILNNLYEVSQSAKKIIYW